MRVSSRARSNLLSPFAALIIGALAAGPALAEEGSSAPHGDGKGSAPPAESGEHASAKGSGGEGGKGETHRSSGGEGKSPQNGSNEHSEPAKDAAPPAQTGKDGANIEPGVEPVRRLDKKNKPGENSAPRAPGAQGPPRQSLPLPQPPNPVHNSIGVVVPAPIHAGPSEGTHLPTVAPRPPSATAPVPPGNVTGVPGKPALANPSTAKPVIAPPVASRGAINGTNVTRHNVGPSRIGGPSASVAGINGTAIRSKH
jgi:hypothetical protein